MLTGPHLRVRVQKKELQPSFVKLDKHLDRAKSSSRSTSRRWFSSGLASELTRKSLG